MSVQLRIDNFTSKDQKNLRIIVARITNAFIRLLTLLKGNNRAKSVYFRIGFLSVLLISMSTSLAAQFSGGDGSVSSPYQIASASDLNNIRDYLDKHFILVNNINMDVAPYNSSWGWDPIGSIAANERFTGTIDGAGYTIDDLYIGRPNEDQVGLIAATNSGEIKNLGLRFIDISGYSSTGGLIGFNGGTAITNCFVTGTINSTGSAVGGLTGNDWSGHIKDSYSEVTLSAGSTGGGLVGTLYRGTIEYSFAEGPVTVDDARGGGIAGSLSESEIEYSYALGAISGTRELGGLVGNSSGSTISNTYASGSVSGDYNLAGLVGNIGYNTYNPILTTIEKSYSTGLVTGNHSLGGIGGLVGKAEYEHYLQGDNNYWDTQASGQTVNEDGIGTALGKTTSEMKTLSTFTGDNWDFSVIWGMDSGTNNGYPYLRPSPPFGSGLGTEEEPFEIATLEQLNEVRNYLTNHFIVINDIDMGSGTNNSGGDFWNNGEGWVPIGNSAEKFTGVFNGDGHILEGLMINRPSASNQGLFGYSNGGTIKNVGLVDVEITFGGTSGGVVAILDNLSTIDQVYITGSIDGASIAGGVVGYAIENSVISNSYSIAELSGGDGSGGLVGYLRYGAKIQQSFAAGLITQEGSESRVGGLAGLVRDDASISESYFDTETTGQSGGEGGVVGLTHPQMVLASNFANWDFAEIWDIGERNYDGYLSYPYLRNIDVDETPGKTLNSTPFATNVTINGVFELNETLQGIYTYGDLDDDEEIGTTFKWYRSDDASGTNKVGIPGVSQQEYTVQATDEGKYLSFEVTIGDVYGPADSFESSLLSEEPPTPAIGVFNTGTGTIGNPYQVSTAEQLNEVRNYLSSYFVLTADIDLDVEPYNLDSGWLPIGNEENPFTGTFDGNGFVVEGLYIDRLIHVGLFGFTVNSEIKNLGLTNANVKGKDFVGVLAGWQGADFGSNLISKSYAKGVVQSTTSEGGGLVGRQQATGGTNTIENSFAMVNIAGAYYAGGLVGAMSTSGSSAYNTIKNSYSTGTTSGYSGYGGLVGVLFGSSGTNIEQNSFWDINTSGRYSSAIGSGVPTTSMKNESTFSTWDFSEIWMINSSENDGYPYLQESEPAVIFGGKGTLAEPYQISNPEELKAIRSDLTGHYIIINDIQLDVESDNASRGWDPVGDSENPFMGSLDGGGHTISGLYSNWGEHRDAAGLFGVIKNANISNLHLTDVFVSVGTNSGGLVGVQFTNNGSSSITKCSVSGKVNGQFSIGGIVGKQYAIDGQNYLQYSYSSVELSSYNTIEDTNRDYAAGLVGNQEAGEDGSNYIQASYSRSYDYLEAGLVGKITSASSGYNYVIYSFFDNEVASVATSTLGGIGKTTSEMKTQSTFTDAGWNFTNIWEMNESTNDGYPYFKEDPVFELGDGSSGNPYQIETASQLNEIRNYTSSHFLLMYNIDLGSFAYNFMEGWDPIDNFTGVLDGNGYTINNLVINRSSENNVGLFGYSDGTIKQVGLYDVKITSGSNSGGLVGFFNSGTISETYVTGEINGDTNTGGLVGEHHGRIVHSYSLASVNGEENVGGLVGFNSFGEVDSSYSSGTVTGTGARVLGFIGYSSGGTSTASYWDEETSGVNVSYGGTNKTSLEMKISDSFGDWDFSEIWDIKTGASLSYPYLRGVSPEEKPGDEVLYEFGNGSEGNPYQITTAKQLYTIRLSLDSHYKINNSIDLAYGTQNSSGTYWNDGEGWEPIGTSSRSFTGSLDGGGYSIQNLTINRPETGYQGLFGVASGASISELALENINIVGSGNTGGLIGSLVNNGTIEEVYVTGSLDGGNITGGLVGYFLGLSSISNSYAIVNVLGGDATGGLVGYARESSIENSFSAGAIQIKEEGQRVGSVVALLRDGSSVTNTYWNAQISDQSGEGGSPLTYIQMMDSTDFPGFNFGEVWDIYHNFGYPFLKNVGTNRTSGIQISTNEGWRLMSAPHENITYGELLEPLWTQGFEGADSEEGNPSVLKWNGNSGSFEPIDNADEIPNRFHGFLVYIYADQDYDGFDESLPRILTTEGKEDSADVKMQFSYNSELHSNQRGWSIAGNPWGFPLDRSATSGWTLSNFDASVYVWNAETGEYQSHNGVIGTMENSVIAPWQAFWVKATNGNASITLSKEVRGFDAVFRKKNPVPQLELIVKNDEVSSKTMIMFAEEALEGKDALDAYKLASLNTNFVSIGTSTKDSQVMDIQALPLRFDEPIDLEVYIDRQSSNPNFELSWNSSALQDGLRFYLINQNNGEITKLNADGSIFLEIESSTPKNISVSENKEKSGELEVMSFDYLVPNTIGTNAGEQAKVSGSQSRFILRVIPPNYEDEFELPTEFDLSQNYPNPFNPETAINFDLPESSNVKLEIFDIMGRKVVTLINEHKKAGYHQIRFNAQNLASGTYLYRLVAGKNIFVKKLTLIK